ncbi:MAG: N-acetylmuramoyl-L-alanine amidase [Alphaproteobacteria bacterium]|nr:N-acetylmuramoyl-L-alanine amidase [Alphaproteobacteria bacterium]
MVWYPSPNHDVRQRSIDMLLVHYTDMKNAQLALQKLCDGAAKVSAHYLIDEGGEIFHLVKEDRRAWHAGVASWRGVQDINSASIGIELQHEGHKGDVMADYPAAQIDALITLAQEIMARHNIPPRHILGHSDVAPYRKRDPGEALDWQHLASKGIGVWVDNNMPLNVPPLYMGNAGENAGEAVMALQQNLATYGYDITCDGIFGGKMQQVIIAFQRHFMPQKIDGIACAALQSVLQSILQSIIDDLIHKV